MQHLNLTEWVKSLRVASESQLADFGNEILDLLDDAERLEFLERTVVAEIEHVIKFLEIDKAVDFLIERHNLLTEIEQVLSRAGFAAGFPGDEQSADKALANLLAELEDLRTEIEALKAPEPLEYDL